MVTTIIRFELPHVVDVAQAKQMFLQVAPRFMEPRGLIRQQFLLSEDEKSAGGVCLWEDRDCAKAFIENVMLGMIEERFDTMPTVEYFHTPVVVDNASGEVIS